MVSRLVLVFVTICFYALSFGQPEITELNFDPMSMNGVQFMTLTNQGGTNNFESYPCRPQYNFPGREKIYKLPKMGGDFFFFSDGRSPDIEVDFFILTDPTDASSAMMWMNGTGTKMRMTANPNTDYFLVVDGFANKEASVKFSVAIAPAIEEICNSIGTINLNDFLTMGNPNDDITWSQEEGGSGNLNLNADSFTPDQNSLGKYKFKAVKNFDNKPSVTEEEICLIFKPCPIPTMSHWGLFILALSFMIVGLVAVKIKLA